MKDKKIAIYLVVTIIIFSIIIGITVYMVAGKKRLKGNNVTTQSQSDNVTQNIDVQARTVEHVYENPIYAIDLYTDGTATARVKTDINLWGDLQTTNDEKYKKEKNDMKSILTQSRQIDSNNQKIEGIFVSKYIGDIYDNYYYGKAIIKCEGNTFYLIDLVSDNKIRIKEDWTERCREVNSDEIVLNLQNECLSELLEKQTIITNKNFSGVSSDNKYKYFVCFDEKDEYSVYIHSNETNELLLYGTGKITEENTQIAAGTSYYKFNMIKPNGGVINGTIKQSNVMPDDINKDSNKTQSTAQADDGIIDVKKPIYIELQDFSTESEINFTTDGYYELKII